MEQCNRAHMHSAIYCNHPCIYMYVYQSQGTRNRSFSSCTNIFEIVSDLERNLVLEMYGFPTKTGRFCVWIIIKSLSLWVEIIVISQTFFVFYFLYVRENGSEGVTTTEPQIQRRKKWSEDVQKTRTFCLPEQPVFLLYSTHKQESSAGNPRQFL